MTGHHSPWALAAVLFTACGEEPPAKECDSIEQIEVFTDADGDSWGSESAGFACSAGPEQAIRDGDCDDADPEVHPNADELCDGRDQDCDDEADEGLDFVPHYADTDGDGFGDPLAEPQIACAPPDGAVENDRDCDDTNAAVNPDAQEICNDGIDDDCDGVVDTADADLDPADRIDWYTDDDGDGYGRSDFPPVYTGCNPPENTADNALDCDDDNFAANPGATELEGSGADEDCDGYELCYQDLDGDGWRSGASLPSLDFECTDPPNVGPDLPVDCDDANPAAQFGAWESDLDGDGFGDGVVALNDCTGVDPGPPYLPAGGPEDCDDNDPTVNPDALDACSDGFDANCDGADTCSSCLQYQDAGNTVDGAYDLEIGGVVYSVYCDFTTDGGGWTLVASTNGQTLDDAGTSTYFADLATLTPGGANTLVWDGLGGVIPGLSDIRFTCKNNVAGQAMDVDLSFYAVPWYRELIASSNDAVVCFEEQDGLGDTQPTPERRNNLNGQFRALGDPYAAGYLEGEDSCGDTGDFTVDFDDRGMDNNQADGTDWGEDDSSMKCGTSANGDAWFIFVREIP